MLLFISNRIFNASVDVAGIAVGILAKNNALTPAEVRDWIVNRADIISSTIKLATVADINCSGATSPPTTKPTTKMPTTKVPTTTKPSTTKPSTKMPTKRPTALPTTIKPTSNPTTSPTNAPSTTKPTTRTPTERPTAASSVGVKPTPTLVPTYEPVTLATAKCTPNGSPTQRKCYKQNGNMFSIDTNVNVVLTSITISVSTGTRAEVWTKVGDYIGFETNKTAWKKVGGEDITIIILSMMFRAIFL